MTNRIACDAHDYFEIVCMRRSLIIVTTHHNEVFQGTAENIIVKGNQELLQINDKGAIYLIALVDIKQLQAQGNHPQHNFSFMQK
jgi:Rho-binding antiterminator